MLRTSGNGTWNDVARSHVKTHDTTPKFRSILYTSTFRAWKDNDRGSIRLFYGLRQALETHSHVITASQWPDSTVIVLRFWETTGRIDGQFFLRCESNDRDTAADQLRKTLRNTKNARFVADRKKETTDSFLSFDVINIHSRRHRYISDQKSWILNNTDFARAVCFFSEPPLRIRYLYRYDHLDSSVNDSIINNGKGKIFHGSSELRINMKK